MLVVFMLLISMMIILLTYNLLNQKINKKYNLVAYVLNAFFLTLFIALFSLETRASSDNQILSTSVVMAQKPTRENDYSYKNVENDKEWKVNIKEQVLLDAPIIKQYPELPRGCEVTSLAMLLQHANVKIDKMELAELVKKDPTVFRKESGKVYFGNPNDGFVGDMYNLKKPGYGVYHKPIKELAERFLPGEIQDITGRDFESVKAYLSAGYPVWIISNATYKELDPSSFQVWDTPTGQVKITYREHSVLITGYDTNYIYFNDPISGEKNRKAPIQDFIRAWEQMGSQAITIGPKLNLN
ncbi:C39 family peptidase [Bacillus sp. DJP31]|uniref:C39 family peptidase n=1 Tax=Bacillus sp. DJP31 TaxID=3409789 RepID=UPI003BB6F58F